MHGFERTPELAKVFQGFFPAPEGAPDGKDKREDDRDAQQGKVHIVINIEIIGQKNNNRRNEQYP